MATWNELINDRLGTFTIADNAAAIADTAGVDMFLNDGVRDIIEQCRTYKPQLLPLFTATTTQVGDNTIAARPNIDILKVTATTSSVEYFARYVSSEEIVKAVIPGSIFAATSEDPIWSIIDSTITVLPADATNYKFTEITATTTMDASAATGPSNPSNFPADLHYLLAMYGAIKVLQYIAATKADDAVNNIATAVTKIGELSSATADAGDLTDIQDALDKAQALVDETSMGGGEESQNAQYWLLDEDTDMVSSTISVAAQEISRASTIMSAMDKKTGITKSYTDTVDILIKAIQGILTVASSLQGEYMAFFKKDEKGGEGEA